MRAFDLYSLLPKARHKVFCVGGGIVVRESTEHVKLVICVDIARLVIKSANLLMNRTRKAAQ